MENYEKKLLEIRTMELSMPKSNISYNKLAILASSESSIEYKEKVYELAKLLPFQVPEWPNFGGYADNWYNVEVNSLKYQLQFCERGSFYLRKDCDNQIELYYYVLDSVIPSLTSAAIEIANKLHQIKDQRLLIWLRMSSKIYHMYQINQYFGKKMLINNVTWMCQELVRMGLFNTTSEAFKSESHIIQGLCISGLPNLMATELYNELK